MNIKKEGILGLSIRVFLAGLLLWMIHYVLKDNCIARADINYFECVK